MNTDTFLVYISWNDSDQIVTIFQVEVKSIYTPIAKLPLHLNLLLFIIIIIFILINSARYSENSLFILQ